MLRLFSATAFSSLAPCYLPVLLLFMLGSLLFTTAPAQEITANPLLNKMIVIAVDNGGAGRLEDLNALKRQIEALPKTARGNRSTARTANEQALAAFNAGQYEQAKQLWMTAHQTDPGDIEIANNLGMAYLKVNDFPQAFKLLSTTLRMSPGRSAAWANLAEYFARQEKPQQAVACYALAFHFSQNQNRTRSYLQKLASSDESPQVRQAVQQALNLDLMKEGSGAAAIVAGTANTGLNKESQERPSLLGQFPTQHGKAFIKLNEYVSDYCMTVTINGESTPIKCEGYNYIDIIKGPIVMTDQIGKLVDVFLLSVSQSVLHGSDLAVLIIHDEKRFLFNVIRPDFSVNEESGWTNKVKLYENLTMKGYGVLRYDQKETLFDLITGTWLIDSASSKDGVVFYFPVRSRTSGSLGYMLSELDSFRGVLHVSDSSEIKLQLDDQEISWNLKEAKWKGVSKINKIKKNTHQRDKILVFTNPNKNRFIEYNKEESWLALKDTITKSVIWKITYDRSRPGEVDPWKIDHGVVEQVIPIPSINKFLVDVYVYQYAPDLIELRHIADGSLIRKFPATSSGSQVIAVDSSGRYAYVAGFEDQSDTFLLELIVDLTNGKEERLLNRQKFLFPVRAAIFTPDSRYLITAETDGALRVWNFETRDLVAQLYTFEQDGQTEWLAITPEGYYSASAGGARLLKVKTANGVYSIDRFAAEYDRPDIVQLALQLGDSQRAIAQLSNRPAQSLVALEPPKVWFEAPAEGLRTQSNQIEVVLRTEDLASPAESIELRVNGRPLNVAETKGKPVRPDSSAGRVKTYRQTIPLVPGHNWIEAIARNQAGALSEPRLRLIVREGEAERKPNLYYLGIGVSAHPRAPLKFPAQDVRALADTLQSQAGKAFARVKTELLLDQAATRDHLQQALGDFFTPAQRGDLAVVFISGHGMNAPNGYHFLTYDGNPDALEQTAAAWKIFESLYRLPAQVLLLVDTCHAGNIAGPWKQQALIDPDQFLRNAALNNVIVMASSSGQQVSLERADWGHGAFTKALLEGLQGKAADANGIVDLALLQRYVRQRVRTLTDGLQEPRIPRLTGGGEFLELVLAR